MLKFINDHYYMHPPKRKNTFLHAAIAKVPYNLKFIEIIVELGVKLEVKNKKGNTPLHVAIENPLCCVELIKILLDHGANPNVRNSKGDTPLHMLINKCSQGPDIDRNSEMIKLLLTYGARPNSHNKSYLTPIQMAVDVPYCHPSVIAELIKHGAEVDICMPDSRESLVHKAVKTASAYCLDIIKLLLHHSPDLIKYKDIQYRTPLHTAILFGANLTIIEELINQGANVNSRDIEKNTPLHLARKNRYVLEFLVKHGADINAKNIWGYTPLLESMCPRLYAVDPTIVTALIELGSDLEVVGRDGNSALHYALGNSSFQPGIVRLLLENSVKPYNVNFPCIPPVYNCSDNKQTALLYLQFFILHHISEKSRINKPEKMISFDLYGPALSNVLSKFRDSCTSEIFQMRKDRLSKDVLLYSYVWENIVSKNCFNNYSTLFVKEVLDRIYSNKYPSCTDLLRGCLKRKNLIDYLSFVIVYVNVPGSKHSITLDYDSTLHLAKFLDKNTLLNLVIAFSGYLSFKNKCASNRYKKKKHNTSHAAQNYSERKNSGIKRKCRK